MTDDIIAVEVTSEDNYFMGNVILLWSRILLRIKINCQSYKAFKKIASKNSGIMFMIIIIYFFNYDDDDDDDDDDYDDVTDWLPV